jgi:CO dehydrogenase maturation factor
MSANGDAPLWLAVAGKGGSGKSVIAGTLARLLARRGHDVLAVDSDPMPGLARSLGIEEPASPPLLAAAEKPEQGRWRLRPGIGPARAVARFTSQAPDGVRLLQLGKADKDGLVPINGSVNAFLHVVHRMHESKRLRALTVVGDLPAGPRHPAAGFAPYARLYVVVVEPTSQSALTARRVMRIAREHRNADVLLVANKVAAPEEDLERIARLVGEEASLWLPADVAVADAERAGAALLDTAPESPAVEAISRLADSIEERRLVRL